MSFFDPGFMPHIHCYLGSQPLVWTMVVTDLLIGFAYIMISLTLWGLISRTKLPFSYVVICFGIFIGACGATHFMEVWTLWHPDYWAAAFVKIVTALASVGTGAYLYRLRPALLQLAAAAKRSQTQKQDLLQVAYELEKRVEERTQTLRENEALLVESEAKFRTIADALPQMVWSTTNTGQVDYYNSRWYEFTGQDPKLGLHFDRMELVHPEDRAAVLNGWRHSLETGAPYQTEIRLLHASGTYRWILSRAIPVRDKNNDILRWMGTSTDIHDQKQVQADLALAIQARDEFLSIASHELKTPLTSLKLQSQLALRQIKKGSAAVYTKENVDERILQTDKQANRLTRLVDDMLDIARIRSGRLTLNREDVDLSEVIGDVLDRLGPQLSDNGKLLPTAPTCTDVNGFWDRLRLEQVVTNLLTNAVRYGQGNPIQIYTYPSQRHVRFTIIDAGIGIADDLKVKIFDRFERAVDANEVSGMGLGLYITKQIVEAHGGTVTVESKLGVGSCFEVTLPRDGGAN
jgi:PAS domain S-box-containing protein